VIAAAIFVALTWLLAGVPFGLILSTLYGPSADLREQGSGNTGATNVLRVAGARVAAPALALDLLKGAVPVWLAAWMWPDWGATWWTVVGLTAFAGHCWPVYLEFRGGKGVATSAGVTLAASPWVAVVAALTWGIVLGGTGRSSLASLVGAFASVAASFFLDRPILALTIPLALLIAWTHRANLGRLWAGEEEPVVAVVRQGPTPVVGAEEALRQGPAGAEASDSGY
jgi:glycerol-3-phosphate acyltransferase PlsY